MPVFVERLWVDLASWSVEYDAEMGDYLVIGSYPLAHDKWVRSVDRVSANSSDDALSAVQDCYRVE